VALVCWRLRRLAKVDREILLLGETGVGKEIFAKAVHRASGRAGAFVPINCAALPGELIESELFGFERGAHAQATQGKPGLLEQAEGGTLFLDEIGEMPQELQVKLLRFLQDREVTPLGGTRPRRLDVRVVAATSRPIPAAASADETSSLRPDLLMRFGPEPILLPPLRDRIEDLGLLARAIGGGAPLRFEPIALQALSLYSWPGNVRELGKVLEDARLFSGAEAVGLDALPAGIAQLDSSSDDLPDDAPTRPAPTAAELKSALRQSRGVMRHAARLLGRQPSLVYRWCHRHGIDPTVFR
jgi:two-component system NtrC family response regulator